MPSTQHAVRGVALFEVILASIILSIGLTVTLSLASTALSRQRLGEKSLTAAWLADEQLGLVVMEGPQQFLLSQPTSGSYAPPFEDFAYEVEVQHVGDYEPYLVTVFVSWEDGRRNFSLETEVAPRHGEPELPEARKPMEPIDREALYFEEGYQ